jgi:hypothetical protein
MEKVGRNDPCPCGSGQKYKKCCLAKDDAARVADLGAKVEAAAAAAAAKAAEEEAKDDKPKGAAPKAQAQVSAQPKPKPGAGNRPSPIRRKAV